MSWCCLTSGDERSAIKIEGYARNDDGAKRYQNAAALHHFLRRTTISEIRFGVQVDGFRVVVAASLQNIYLRRSRHHHFSFLISHF